MSTPERADPPRCDRAVPAGRWVPPCAVRQLADELGVSWLTITNAVTDHGTPLVEDPARISRSRDAGYEFSVARRRPERNASGPAQAPTLLGLMLRRRLNIALGIVIAFKDWLTMLYLLRKRGTKLRRVRTRDGIRFDLRETRWDALILREMFVDQPYSQMELKPDPVVVDVGAFIGDFSLLAAIRWGATVHAYEPIAEHYERLLAHIELNNQESRVVPHFGAVGRRTGTLVLNVTSDGLDLHASAHDYEDKEHRTVPSVSLNDIVADLGRVDLLKVDCEGGEYDIIGGASIETLQAIDAVVAEWHRIEDYEARLAGLTARLEQAGFNVQVTDDILQAERAA